MGKRRESKGGDPYTEEYDMLVAEVDELHKVGWCCSSLHIAIMDTLTHSFEFLCAAS